MENKRIVLSLLTVFLCMTLMLGGCNMGAKESTAPEKYPVKPINIIVPFAAGGSADIIARTLEKSAQQHLGQPLVVLNMPGGAATIGMNEMAGAQADGYTIGVIGINAILQPLYGETRYHYPTALEPLVKVVSSPIVLAVRSDKPWQNLNDLVSYAKANPGKIKFGHAGLGTTTHLTGELFGKEANINIVQVPFKGDSEALASLLGDHVHLILSTPPALKEHVKSGSIKILGAAEEKRLTLSGFENVPTFKEQGINVAFDFWIGVVAPKGIPAAEKAKLAAGLKEMINAPEFSKSMQELGMVAEYLGPAEFKDRWIADNEKLTKVTKETGIADVIKAQKK
ncbi:hypothetical protein SPSPH_041600 [Sporomusa sphaeroides DSM 2875]|uniref:Tripartite tricarboxylate transporter family receptor n=3 Tax=Sporomusa TaxID=2375 RepID=A0ABM9W503_9FIRM|nr:tripartite tricarboxylate transporter family receptor [Sporomusa sphaeroides DSM 2875]CVK20210.1 Tripartite tricarboxylate transporter family receptor [Sporomusa sphaeroides DSM 2875]SCM82758.1 conserved exported hypothetical protein [uncultured Sporomusa sp.]